MTEQKGVIQMYELHNSKLVCPLCQAELEPLGNYESVKCECGAELYRLGGALKVDVVK
jgi:hypothetical protein